jgi:hypothetical protein
LSLSQCDWNFGIDKHLRSLIVLHSYNDVGAKLKSFVPIIKATSSGYTTVVENDRLDSAIVEKKKMRSLKEIDFRNCLNLIDTDVSIICSLHTMVRRELSAI